MQPPQLAPALVNVLLGDGDVTPKAIETTARALVREGHLRCEQKADGTLTVRPASGTVGLRPLRPFEELLMERVRHRCRFGVDRVPIEALGPGDGDEYWVWWRGFERSVRDEAMALGLTRPARKKSLTLLLRGAAITAWFVLLCVCLPRSPYVLRIVLGVLLNASMFGVAMLDSFPIRTRPRLTALGRQAAQWWRDDDTGAEHRLPRRQVGANGPESALPVREARRIWSAYGRSWHVVDTAPLDPPRWGHLWQLVLLGAATCAATITVALSVHIPFSGELAASPLLVGAVAAALWLPARRRIQAVPAELTFRGAVISRWDFETHHDDPLTDVTHYCCAIEDPASRKGWSFEVNEWRRPMFTADKNLALKDRFRVGDVVDIHCSPRLRRVYRISVVEAVPR